MTQNNEKLLEKLEGIYETLAARQERDVQRQSTGFRELDKLTTGLADGSLVVIAARPAMGKTALALDIAHNLAAIQEKATVYFSYEMSAAQIAMRMLRKSRSGEISWEEAIRLSQSNLTQSRLLVYDVPNTTVEDMQSICESTENLGAVIVDYVQLIHHSAYNTLEKNRFATAQNDTSWALKMMAQKLNVPVICISQLSRACEDRADKRPVLADMRTALHQDADQILLLYRDRYYDPETPLGDIAECIVAKNRYGDVGTVKLLWDPEHIRFSERIPVSP